jgi:hypothetical protein
VSWGPPYSGGQTLTAALGTVYSSNLTPDKQTGIGGWTPDYAVISRERHI